MHRERARIGKTCQCICHSPVKCPGHSAGAGVTLPFGNPFTAPQPLQNSAYIPTDCFQQADTSCRTEKNAHLLGREGFLQGMRKDKRADDITAFHCAVGDWKYFQAHFLPFFFNIWFSYMDLMGFHTCILKVTTYRISHLQWVIPLEISGVDFGCVPKLRQTFNNKCKDFSEEYIFSSQWICILCFAFYSKNSFISEEQLYSFILLANSDYWYLQQVNLDS